MTHKRLLNEFNVYVLLTNGDHIVKCMSKAEILQTTCLNSRDLRLHLPNQPTGMFIRDHAFVVNMIYVKMIITKDQILIFELESGEELNQLVMLLSTRLKEKEEETPFEFFVLEIILKEICLYLYNQCQVLQLDSFKVLDRLLIKPIESELVRLLQFTKDLKKWELVTKAIETSLDDLLDNSSNEIKRMYLSYKAEYKTEPPKDILNMEDLIELYLFEVDKILNRIQMVDNTIEESSETLKIMLDVSRNKIMIIDVWLNVLTFAICIMTFITGVFGMNVPNPWEDSVNALSIIVSCSFSVVVILIGYCKATHLKNIRM